VSGRQAKRSRIPSPALLIACLALLIALGGTSYAAFALPKNSVGAIQIKTGAVSSAKVRDASLGVVDLAPAARLALKGNMGPAARGWWLRRRSDRRLEHGARLVVLHHPGDHWSRCPPEFRALDLGCGDTYKSSIDRSRRSAIGEF
jgi:hypothetical protein